MMKKLIFKRFFGLFAILFFCSNANKATAQFSDEAITRFKIAEKQLIETIDSAYTVGIKEQREEICLRFIKDLKQILKEPDSYAYPFDSLSNYINILESPDKKFRILNWSLEVERGMQRYFGAIQMNERQLKLMPLVDISAEITKGLDDSIFSGPRWFGGIVYNIIPQQIGPKTYYFMLTANNAHNLSTFKVMDPMEFVGNTVKFGAPLFAIASETRKGERANRFVLEYKKGVSAVLNWDNQYKAVMFDRLISVANDPARKYTYVPTGEYDALIWETDRWVMKQNIIPIAENQDGRTGVVD